MFRRIQFRTSFGLLTGQETCLLRGFVFKWLRVENRSLHAVTEMIMPISVTCGGCGKTLLARDSAASKKTQCPDCGTPMIIPEVVADTDFASAPDFAAGPHFADTPAPVDERVPERPDAFKAPAAVPTDQQRIPCPVCGEMIVSTAAKCRFCGEILDPRGMPARGPRDEAADRANDDMTSVDWVVALMCCGIGSLVGVVWLIEGKRKAVKMLVVSILAPFFWSTLFALMRFLN